MLQTTRAGATESDFLSLVGELPLQATTPILSEPTSKRALALLDDRIEAWDPSTLQKTATLSLAPYRLFASKTGSPTPYAWGPGPKLFLIAYGPTDSDVVRSAPYLATVDPVNLRLESVRPISPTLFPPGISAKGMSYYAPENRLYLVGQDSNSIAGTYATFLTEVDVGRAAAWTDAYRLGAECQILVGKVRQVAVTRLNGTTRLYFACGAGSLIVANEPGLPGVLRVDIANRAQPTVKKFPVAGTYASGETMFDQATGRLVLMSQAIGAPAQNAWIFDEAQEAIVGVVSAGNYNVNASGIDPTSGRIFVSIDGAVLSTTYLGRRPPQAVSTPVPGATGSEIVSLPFARRVLVPRRVGNPPRTNYWVYDNKLPDYVPPPPVDLDEGTADIPEVPGKTGATYSGDAKAYGARVHQVAGVNGVVQNVFLPGEYWRGTGGVTGLNDGDRGVFFGRVINGRLAQGEASAAAVTTDGDANTRADSFLLTKQKWPYEAAACSDLGAGRATGSQSEASTTCDLKAALVEARASRENNNTVPVGADSASGVVSFGYSASSSKLESDPKRGLVVTTTAESRDVVFGGVVRFGKITSTSKSVAHGARNTAAASYERKFENVTMPGFSCEKDCDPDTVVQRMNAALPTLVAELPTYETTASPGGARGSVLRDPWQHEQDRLLNNFADTDLEIPGLRVTYYLDNVTRSRVILEFAATLANSTYKRYSLPSFEDDPTLPDIDLDPALEDLFAGSNLSEVFDIPGVDGAPSTASQAAQVAQLTSAQGGDDAPSLGRRLGHGLRLLLTGRRALLLNALLWSLLSLPVFLIGRRRHLLRLIGRAAS